MQRIAKGALGAKDEKGVQVHDDAAFDLINKYVLPPAGYLVWILGTIVCFVLLWNTNTDDSARNWMMAMSGFAVLFFSTIVSVTLFGFGELLKHVIRIQRRVRAFMSIEAQK